MDNTIGHIYKCMFMLYVYKTTLRHLFWSPSNWLYGLPVAHGKHSFPSEKAATCMGNIASYLKMTCWMTWLAAALWHHIPPIYPFSFNQALPFLAAVGCSRSSFLSKMQQAEEKDAETRSTFGRAFNHMEHEHSEPLNLMSHDVSCNANWAASTAATLQRFVAWLHLVITQQSAVTNSH